MQLKKVVIQLWCSVMGLSLLPWLSQACKCAGEPTLLKAFQGSGVVLEATLLKKLNTSNAYSYSAQIIRTWKGCSSLNKVNTTVITTRTDSAACGVLFLKPGSTYLISGSLDSSTKSVSINSCRFQSLWSKLSASEKNQVASLSKKYSNCTTCTPQSCGPRPGTPNFLCPDNSTVAGPSKCSYNQALGVCAWEIVKCPTCQKQSDCHKGQFCSVGKCRAAGTCASDTDCWNPDNTWANTACTGAPRCNKSSKCTLDCAHPCPGGSSVVNCVADPCSVTSCKEPHVSCSANYCGGCNAVFFNSSGYHVCIAKKNKA